MPSCARIDAADAALRTLGVTLFHGLYAGITAVPRQIEEAVRAWRELFPRVVGLKMFAGHSTGNMGITPAGGAGAGLSDARRAGVHRRAGRALREGGAHEAG